MRVTKQSWSEIRTWWRGEMSLTRTVLMGALIYWLGYLAWWVLVGDWDEHLYTQEWLHRRGPWVALTTLLMLVWAIPVFRVCLNRLSQRKNLFLSFAVFMTTGYLLLNGMAQQFSEGLTVARVLRADDSPEWQALDVYADPALGRIVAIGDVTAHSAERFERVLRANPQYQVVQMESLGGYVRDARRMAALVQERHMSTVSFRVCASACTLVFAAGQQRFLGPNARFGFHRSGYPTMPLTAPPSESDLREAQYLRSRGVAEDFIQHELATPHHTVWKPTHAEMFAAEFATHRWSERPAGW